MPTKDSPKILSLDGGGVRGIGSLYILRELMSQVQRTQKGDNKTQLRPCDYFDLICGTSTGGLIAIMLGRLRYTVQQAIEQYTSLAEKVFTTTSSATDAKYDHEELERVIQDIIVNAHLPMNDKLSHDSMMEDGSVGTEFGGCRTFVVAIRTRGGHQAARLRTYGTDEACPFDGKIWEAARATSAAPTFFAPVRVAGVKYGDGGTGWNNPTREAINEARVIWPNLDIGCLISIGTGEDLPLQLVEAENLPTTNIWQRFLNPVNPATAFMIEVAKYCKDALTNCKTVHDDILQNQDRDDIRGRYFRFNTPGMGIISLDEWRKLSDMIALTETYMESPTVRGLKLDAARLIAKEPGSRPNCVVNQAGESKIGNARAPELITANSAVNAEAENLSLDLQSMSKSRPVTALLRAATEFHVVSASFKTLIEGDLECHLWISIVSIKTAFRLECFNLLATVDSSVKLPEFDSILQMDNPDIRIPLRHRTTTAVQARLSKVLGLVGIKLETLQQIQQDLRKLFGKRLSLQDTPGDSLQNYINSSKCVVLELKKLTSCLTDIVDTIKTDCQHSDDPASNYEAKSATEPQLPGYNAQQVEKRLSHFQVIQRTSSKLYEALGKICKKHEQHSAHFLLHRRFEQKDVRDKPYIPFDLRFSSYDLDVPNAQLYGVSWLNIRSFYPRDIQQETVQQTFNKPNTIPEAYLNPSSKRSFPPPNYRDPSKRIKLSHQRSAASDSGYESIIFASPKGTETRDTKPDFGLRDDFCTKLQAYEQGTSENPARFIGYLEKKSNFNHQVSFSPLYLELGDGEPISLTDMFDLMTIGPSRNITNPSIPSERVELAKQIASAMLQFQGTPLLRWAWSSNDVMFFKRYPNSIRLREMFKAPYLAVNIQKDQQNQHSDTPSQSPDTLVYNRCLLSLAITLIEIAYQTPIQHLRTALELDEWGDSEEMTDHAIVALALRLQRSVSAELGLRYQTIVGKCLQVCRHQRSQGFEEPSFKAEIFRDIVIELDELKQWMVDEGNDDWMSEKQFIG